MNVKKVAVIIGRKDGAFQMSKGRIGSFAYLPSQIKKAARCKMETTRRMYSYGSFHPTAGAWLARCQQGSRQESDAAAYFHTKLNNIKPAVARYAPR